MEAGLENVTQPTKENSTTVASPQEDEQEKLEALEEAEGINAEDYIIDNAIAEGTMSTTEETPTASSADKEDKKESESLQETELMDVPAGDAETP
mmetsp:Transcript_25930/g.54110  ORF Transcript_25930/g.54110 Transcript_25930/m.54110 type:complete len:95 (-) Transcript_25930:95-379(-)